jgi:hypothetical protein
MVVVGVLLAGCFGTSGSSSGEDGDDLRDFVTDELGAISGSVIDESLFPLPYIIVNATQGSHFGRDVESNVDGAFVVPLLLPGAYILTVNQSGYQPRQQRVDVAPGEVTQVQLLLYEVGRKEPHHLQILRKGYEPCAAALVLTPANFGRVCDPANDRASIYWDVPPDFEAIVIETVWASQNDETAHFYYCCNYTAGASTYQRILDYAWGRSPTKVILYPDVQNRKPDGPIGEQYGPPPNRTEFRLHSRMFWAGYFGEYTQTFQPGCRQVSFERCSGVGFHPGFGYDVWMSIFVHGILHDLKSYSALPDQ